MAVLERDGGMVVAPWFSRKGERRFRLPAVQEGRDLSLAQRLGRGVQKFVDVADLQRKMQSLQCEVARLVLPDAARVHADDAALQVKEGAAAVPRVQGGRRLNVRDALELASRRRSDGAYVISRSDAHDEGVVSRFGTLSG